MDTERQITRISRLLVKFLDGALSAEELGELEAWRDSSEANGQLFRKLASGEWDAADYRRYRAALEADGWEGSAEGASSWAVSSGAESAAETVSSGDSIFWEIMNVERRCPNGLS